MPFETNAWARQDAYSRLPFDAARTTASDLHAGSITFLDHAGSNRPPETVAGYLDEVPPWLLARPTWVLIRWTDVDEQIADAAAVLQQSLVSRGIDARIGLVAFQLGEEPTLVLPTGSEELAPERARVLLQRARRVELASFLEWGGSIWRPRGYHYQFPSGRHSRIYVRLADAFTDVRAAPALATWLYRHIKDPTTAVVVDTGSLGPLVTELRSACERNGKALGPIIGIDSYPPSALGMQQKIKKLTDALPVLGLVSVSDSGNLARQLSAVLESSGSTASSVEQIVARSLEEASALPDPASDLRSHVLTAPWFSLASPGADPASPPCEACRDPESARVVRIDPRSMSAMLLAEPELLMPDITDARRNATLWEAYEGDGDPASRPWVGLLGPTGTRAIGAGWGGGPTLFFEPACLLRDHIVSERRHGLDRLPMRARGDDEKRSVLAARDAAGVDAAVVVLDDVEANLFESGKRADLLIELAPFLAEGAAIVRCSKDGSLRAVEGSTDIPAEPAAVLVVALGLRTGVTLHRMFLVARQRWPSAVHRGLVVHAHPADDRIWASARNTFKDQDGVSHLLALWLTYLPLWSPLAEELEFLNRIPATDLSAAVRSTLLTRRDALGSGRWIDDPLWGPTGPKLQGGSYLGDRLGAQAVLAAVGAAMQSARIRVRGTPGAQAALFDLPRVFRSYFDGLIHVAVLRWSLPGEAWWGASPADGVQLVDEVRGRMPLQDWTLILPELLFAALQGKLRSDQLDLHVVALANEALINGDPTVRIADARSRAFLSLGLELWDRSVGRGG